MSTRFGSTQELIVMHYEGSPKHREPWQRGRQGSLCPNNLNQSTVKQLLADSVLVGNKRYAIYEGRPYCAQRHAPDRWHGYPIGWVEVPEPLRRNWLKERRLQRRDVRRHWKR